MKSAVNQAIYVAYKQAHQEVKVQFKGIYVLGNRENSQFKSLKSW